MVKKLNKRGNFSILSLAIMSVICMIVLFVYCLLYIQTISIIMDVKKDLYYISQNGVVANDKEDLALGTYNNSDKDIQKYIEEVLNKNYVKGTTGIVKIEINECRFIKDISIVKAHTNNRYDVPIIHIDLTIYFRSIIKTRNIEDVMKIKLHEDVKASLLKYEEVM